MPSLCLHVQRKGYEDAGVVGPLLLIDLILPALLSFLDGAKGAQWGERRRRHRE